MGKIRCSYDFYDIPTESYATAKEFTTLKEAVLYLNNYHGLSMNYYKVYNALRGKMFYYWDLEYGTYQRRISVLAF
jgi:hypothetical protein